LTEGFGFSDTALRIFILMASRRLKSDSFFTVDLTPAVYTQAGGVPEDWLRIRRPWRGGHGSDAAVRCGPHR